MSNGAGRDQDTGFAAACMFARVNGSGVYTEEGARCQAGEVVAPLTVGLAISFCLSCSFRCCCHSFISCTFNSSASLVSAMVAILRSRLSFRTGDEAKAALVTNGDDEENEEEATAEEEEGEEEEQDDEEDEALGKRGTGGGGEAEGFTHLT